MRDSLPSDEILERRLCDYYATRTGSSAHLRPLLDRLEHQLTETADQEQRARAMHPTRSPFMHHDASNTRAVAPALPISRLAPLRALPAALAAALVIALAAALFGTFHPHPRTPTSVRPNATQVARAIKTIQASGAISSDLPQLATLLPPTVALSVSPADPQDVQAGVVTIMEDVLSTRALPGGLRASAEHDILALNRAIWTGDTSLQPPLLVVIVTYHTNPHDVEPQVVAWSHERAQDAARVPWATLADPAAAWHVYSAAWGARAIGPWPPAAPGSPPPD